MRRRSLLIGAAALIPAMARAATPITFGAVSARALGFGQAATTILPTFVGRTTFKSLVGSNAVTWPAGAQAGDLAFIFLSFFGNPSTDTPTGLSGWTDLNNMVTTNPGSNGQGVQVWMKQLVAGDISAPPGIGNITGTGLGSGGCNVVVYRNTTTAAVLTAVSHSAQTATTLTISGTKTGAAKGFIVFVTDRDAGTITGSADNGFTYRGGGDAGEAFWSTHIFDLLNTSYGNGTITMQTFINSNEQMGCLVELR